MIKEAYDDIKRHRQSTQGNKNTFTSIIQVKDIKNGDIIEIKKNQRVPTDMLLLKILNKSGTYHIFIRTDQLDGETDWKLRKAHLYFR